MDLLDLKVQNVVKEFFIVRNKKLVTRRDEKVSVRVSDVDFRVGARSNFQPLNDISRYYATFPNRNDEIMRIDLNRGHQSIHFPKRDIDFLIRIPDMFVAVTLEHPFDSGLSEQKEHPNRTNKTNDLSMRSLIARSDTVPGATDWKFHQDLESIPYLRGEYGVLRVTFTWEQQEYYTPRGITMENMWEDREKTADILLRAENTQKKFKCHKNVLQTRGFPMDNVDQPSRGLPVISLPNTGNKAVERLLEHVYERQVNLLPIRDFTDLFEAFKVAYTWNLASMRDEFGALLIRRDFFSWTPDEILNLHSFVSHQNRKNNPTCQKLLHRCYYVIDRLETDTAGDVYKCDQLKDDYPRKSMLQNEVKIFIATQR